MEVRSFRNNKHDLTIYTFEGAVDFGELLKTVQQFYEENPTRKSLWDFSLASAWDIRSTEVEQLADMDYRFDKSRSGAKAALVASDEMIQAMSELFILFGDAREIASTSRLFHSKQKALDWLME